MKLYKKSILVATLFYLINPPVHGTYKHHLGIGTQYMNKVLRPEKAERSYWINNSEAMYPYFKNITDPSKTVTIYRKIITYTNIYRDGYYKNKNINKFTNDSLWWSEFLASANSFAIHKFIQSTHQPSLSIEIFMDYLIQLNTINKFCIDTFRKNKLEVPNEFEDLNEVKEEDQTENIINTVKVLDKILVDASMEIIKRIPTINPQLQLLAVDQLIPNYKNIFASNLTFSDEKTLDTFLKTNFDHPNKTLLEITYNIETVIDYLNKKNNDLDTNLKNEKNKLFFWQKSNPHIDQLNHEINLNKIIIKNAYALIKDIISILPHSQVHTIVHEKIKSALVYNISYVILYAEAYALWFILRFFMTPNESLL